MKILERKKLDPPIFVAASDMISLLWNEEVILVRAIGKSGVFHEAIIFELEKGDFLGDSGIGGVFVGD